MRTYFSLPAPPLASPSNLTIGNFDGVHLGHQALIALMAEDAHRAGRQAGLLTFNPHPVSVLRGAHVHSYLTSIDERLELLARTPLDFVIVYPFTVDTATLSAREFMAQVHAAVQLRSLWVGPDFALGRGREGNVAALQAVGQELGFTVHPIHAQTLHGDEVRSGRIRAFLLDGDVEAAARQLGRLYEVQGVVAAGAQRGRGLGFPTANLRTPPGQLLPANGVYATWAWLLRDGEDGAAGSQRIPSVTNVGVRPSFDNGLRTVETHLLDFDGDLYGRTMKLEFVARLRTEQRFESVDALAAQIAHDVAAARQVLSAM